MGLFSSSKSSSSTNVRTEDNRISADGSFIAQVRDVGGDVTFVDPGAIRLGEAGLDLAGNIASSAFASASEAGRGAVAGLGQEVIKAAIPLGIVAIIIWGITRRG